MDKIAEALVKLIETGAPLAEMGLILYYTKSILESVLTAGTLLGGLYLVTKTVRKCQKAFFDYETERRSIGRG